MLNKVQRDVIDAVDEKGWSFVWEWDQDADLSWLQPGDTVEEVLGCVLRDADGATLESLWGICDPDSAYAREVEADLSHEALARGEV